MSVPLIVILALVFAGLGGASKHGQASGSPAALPALTPSAPPSDPATVAPCTKVLQALPEELGDLQPRVVHPKPDSVFVVAWGQPPVILRCGVPRPSELHPGSADFVPVVNGVAFVEKDTGDAHVYTAIDRAAYIEISLPKSGGAGPLPLLAAAITRALPAVCVPQAGPGQQPPDPARLCTHRH